MFLSSIEKTGWANLFLHKWLHANFFKQKAMLTFLFWNFLDNYVAKSDIIRFIDAAGRWKLIVYCYRNFLSFLKNTTSDLR